MGLVVEDEPPECHLLSVYDGQSYVYSRTKPFHNWDTVYGLSNKSTLN